MSHAWFPRAPGRGRGGAPIARRALLGLVPATACAQAADDYATPFDLPAREGPLQPLGGLRLHTERIGIGSFSALHLAPDLTLTALNDRGRWIRARLLMREGRPSGLGTPYLGQLRDGSGEALSRQRSMDSESLARLPDGSWLVGFERWHRIRRFTRLEAPGTYFEAPPGLENAPDNGGLEALATMPDGRLLAIAEFQTPTGEPNLRRAWLGGPGAWTQRSYRPAPGFGVTDAAALPDGSAVVLERYFTPLEGVSARLVHVPRATIQGQGVIEGTPILHMPSDAPAENWEGVAVLPRGDRLWLALIVDDNDNPLQRGLFALFEWRLE
ncbi:esterase-like activity of phytase family protein [Rhodovarius crocodyli]|uniref:Esterase-like activity of phytase family protein n=1 Tax=Rhodovarius crocodyli TaxID=1979269 RepID=A0A437MCV2_9PROT|nr:esterase-like activity of phytase family protein [Rhodovarius crocodyli]RVT95466.1 esterase-like activity of phytase family protein [Rhodovarius crocodyli]